jgi:hypothetical protein
MPSGPKSTFSPAKAEIIIQVLIEGRLIKQACAAAGISPRTLAAWRQNNPDFDRACVHASEIGYDAMAEEMLAIPDTYEDVNRGRLKADGIRWYLSRRAASKYGDKVTLDVNQTVSIGAALSEALARVAVQGDGDKPQAIDITSEVIERDTDLESVDQAKSTTIEDIL